MKINLSDATPFSGGFWGANIVKSEQNLKKEIEKTAKKVNKKFCQKSYHVF